MQIHSTIASQANVAGSPFRQHFGPMSAGVQSIDAKGRFVEFNEVARQMYATAGVSADSLIGKHAIDDAFPDSRDLPTSLTMIRALTERVFTEAESFYPPWGVWFAVRHFPTADGGVTTVFEDITARKLTEEGLRRATEAADIFNWEVDVAAGTLVWSANAHAVLGFPRELLPGSLVDVFALVHPDDLVAMQSVMQAAMARGDKFEMEVRLVHPLTRDLVWITWQGAVVQNVARDRASTRYLGISQNITARKRREANLAFLAEISDDLARLSTAEETMQSVGQKIGAFLQISSCAFNEVDVARAESYMRYGWFRSDVPNLVGSVYRHGDFATDEFDRANAAGKVIVLGDTHQDSRIANRASYDAIKMRSFVTVPFIAGGVWKHMLSVMDSKPREWRADEVELICELCNQIFPRLERATVETALRGSEARFRAAVSAVSSLIWTANAAGEMEGEQPGWSGFTGQTRGELQGHGWAQAVHPEDAQPTLDAWNKAVWEKRMFELEHRVRRLDGEWRVCSVRAVPVNETGEVLEWVGVHTDITERKQADGRLRRLIDSNVQGVIFWNKQGEITEANDAFLRIVGYTRDDLAAGLIRWEAMTPPEYVQQDQRALAEIAATGACTPVKKEYIRKDGTRVSILAGGASLDDNANEGVSFVLDITTLKDAETALLAAHQQQRALSRRLLEVQETERRKIARDLHDQLGQVLTAMKISLQTVQPDAGGPLDPSVALVDRALQQTRSLTLALRPPLLDDLGLMPALRWLVDAQARQAGCRIAFAADPLPDRPAPAVETACFRIAQEAVTNAQRHARATLISVELRLVGDELQLSVRDDGTGFDLVAARTRALRGGSFGVLGMEERATLAGGRMKWESAAGRGTTVQASLPLSPARANDKDFSA